MTHHNRSIGKSILDQLEAEAGSIDSETVTDVLIASLAISMKRIADQIEAELGRLDNGVNLNPGGLKEP